MHALRKKPRVTFDVEQVWDGPDRQTTLLEVLGDSELDIGWVNGQTRCETHVHLLNLLTSAQESRFDAWRHDMILPRQSHLPWCRHIYRELNKEADALATEALLTGETNGGTLHPAF